MDFGFVTLFFNISGGEIFVILLIVFIVFGPSKIPEVARSLGRMMNEVKKASSDISREFRNETSVIERDLKKTTDSLKKDLDPIHDDPLEPRHRKNVEAASTEIPDVYLKNDTPDAGVIEKGNENEEKTEKPIQ
ncbi:MAG: twin-arginine translocase TatA/TatE family subunit [Bacteroidales bacterium]|nr:twin-arginine translocase TatA/TatE family subunit [Bacteroidales bacterium]